MAWLAFILVSCANAGPTKTALLGPYLSSSGTYSSNKQPAAHKLNYSKVQGGTYAYTTPASTYSTEKPEYHTTKSYATTSRPPTYVPITESTRPTYHFTTPSKPTIYKTTTIRPKPVAYYPSTTSRPPLYYQKETYQNQQPAHYPSSSEINLQLQSLSQSVPEYSPVHYNARPVIYSATTEAASHYKPIYNPVPVPAYHGEPVYHADESVNCAQEEAQEIHYIAENEVYYPPHESDHDAHVAEHPDAENYPVNYPAEGEGYNLMLEYYTTPAPSGYHVDGANQY